MPGQVFRILDHAAWTSSQATGELVWSALDRQDGFIHMSLAHQLERTLARHYAGREDLWVLTIAVDRLDSGALRYEPPVGKAATADYPAAERFPHYYGRLPIAAIERADRLVLDAAGRHQIPV